MIKLLKDLFAAADEEERTEHDIHLAAAALLVEVARADHDQDASEDRTMAALLVASLELPEAEVVALLERATAAVDEATSLYEFTSLVNEHYRPTEKRRLIEAMWQVAFADNDLNKYEEHIIRRVAELIYLPHAEFMQCKHTARDGR